MEMTFTEGLMVALQGVLIVFLVLIILMVVLYIMKLFAKDEKKAVQSAPAATPSVAPAAAPITDSDEVIAVISAAVAAMSGDDVTKRLRVMSIRRQGSETPIWSAPKK